MNLYRPHSMTTVQWKCLVLRDVMGHVELDVPQTPPSSAAGPVPPSAVVQSLPITPSPCRNCQERITFLWLLFLPFTV